MVTSSEDISAKIGLKRKRLPHWLLIVVIVLALGGAGTWLYFKGDQGDSLNYVTETASRADIVVTVSAVGSVEPTNLFEISSELSGTIDEVLVDFNDTVEVGTVLARLDTSKLDAQRAVQTASVNSAIAHVAMAMARASLAEARQEYERGLELKARAVESVSAFIAQETAYQRAEADLQSALAS